MLAHRPSSIAQNAHALVDLAPAEPFSFLKPSRRSHSLSPCDMPVRISKSSLHKLRPPCNINTPTQQKQNSQNTPKYAFYNPIASPISGYQCPSSISLLSIPHPLLNPEARIRLPQLLHLRLRQALVNFLHVDQLFHGENLTRDVG